MKKVFSEIATEMDNGFISIREYVMKTEQIIEEEANDLFGDSKKCICARLTLRLAFVDYARDLADRIGGLKSEITDFSNFCKG